MELSRLTRYELELMDVLWQRGEATVQEVCDKLGRPLAYTTVMTTLRLLHSKKKVLKRVKRGRAHVYQPIVSRDDVSSSVIRDMQTVLFGDRLPTLMLGLLENGQFSSDDVDALESCPQKGSKQGGQSMNPLSALETSLSLFVQVTLLIGVTAAIARRQLAGRNSDYYWAALHVCVLLVTAAAFFLPHLRLTVWADLHPAENYPKGGATLQILGSVISWTWATGAFAIVLVGIAGMIRASSIVRSAQTNDRLRGQLLETVPELAAASRPIDVRLTDESTGAFCWQIHRPVIALPVVVVDFPVAEQAAILRHELAHLRRQHPLHLFVQRLVEAIYWFHPLVWWASRQAAAAREIRCDRDAVSNRQDVAVYLRSLLRLIELQLDEPALLPAGLSFLGDSSLLGRRATLLVDSFDKPVAPSTHWRPIFALAVTIAICMLVWIPVNPRASRRADWSPWPTWSARTLDAVGLPVRDYEIDGHRLDGHEH